MKPTEGFKMTKAGEAKLVAELEKLKNEDRPRVLEAIAEARSQGDLSENADYASARELQGVIESRILEIENQLKNKIIVDETRVKVRYVATKEECEFTIVGTIEANPFEGKISNDSPLGKAVVGHKAGDTFYITTESGKELKIKLLEIE